MVKKTVIADAGPLIAFGRIKQLSLLAKTLGEIIIPEEVAHECLADKSRPGANEIKNAIDKTLIEVHANPDINKYHKLLDILGPGEASAIALASDLQAGLLIDEKLGRSTARKMNLKIIGTAGVVLLAKKNKLISQVSPLIHSLKAHGYYLSEELMHEVLQRAEESL